jgi:hypothetical protein
MCGCGCFIATCCWFLDVNRDVTSTLPHSLGVSREFAQRGQQPPRNTQRDSHTHTQETDEQAAQLSWLSKRVQKKNQKDSREMMVPSTDDVISTQPPRLTSGAHYDAVVVGAGIMGSCAAYHLAKRGKKVLLLEQFELLHR